MNLNYTYKFRKTTINNNQRLILKRTICLFLILIFVLNFLFLGINKSQNNQSEFNFISQNNNEDNLFLFSPNLAADPSELQDPFTKNFEEIWDYFGTNFVSNLNLTNYDITLYIREKTNTGTIVDNGVYSLDNLLLYKSLLNSEYTQEEIFRIYSNLKSTPLYYQEDLSSYEYGFVNKVDGDSGSIADYTRNLTNNVMPIYLLLENVSKNLDQIQYSGNTAKKALEDTFMLINSSVFYNSDDKAFLNSNLTSTANIYEMKSNFYTILAYFLIHRNSNKIGNPTISGSAYDMACSTMENLVQRMWDNTNLGFYKSANKSWDFPVIQSAEFKYLDINALGILALLDYWVEHESTNKNSLYYKNATELYNVIDANLYNETYQLYESFRGQNWLPFSPLIHPDQSIMDLEANAIMLKACLKLFEVSGNISYYNRAFDIYNALENLLYNNSINAFETSRNFTGNNTNINFHANLRLSEAYLEAFDLYNRTKLVTTFSSGKTDYIFNQDIINLTSVYKFEKEIKYTEPTSGNNITTYDNITGGIITYIFRYPNETIIKGGFFGNGEIQQNIITNYSRLIIQLNDSLPIANGYTINIKANSSNFAVAFATKTFNIISGLENGTIDDLDELENIYQGQTVNITMPVFSNYNNNITLNVTVSGNGIENYTQSYIKFVNKTTPPTPTYVEFNITAKTDAIPGAKVLHFIFGNESIIYLEVLVEIEILNALTYSNLLYNRKVVEGNNVQISMQLINFLPNNTQDLNLTFTGNYIQSTIIQETLDKNEIKTISTNVLVLSGINVESIEIEMKILKGNTTLQNEIFIIEIVPKFEIISINFPEKIIQGVTTTLVIKIANNQDNDEEFSLIINKDEIKTNIDELTPGENRIEAQIIPTINPYEFGIKTYSIEIKDENGDVIAKDYFESEVQLSTINFIVFFILPIVIPVALILYYKNKEIKIKMLRK